MKDLVQFAILGLGAGAAYALLAQGIVLVYRGSGIVNFAHGALAMVGGYVCFVTLQEDHAWPLGPAFLVAVLFAAAASLAFQQLVLRALERAAPIVRLIATLGLLTMLQALVTIKYGVTFRPVDQFLPDDVYDVAGIAVQQDRLILAGIAGLVTLGLWAFVRFSRTGLAISGGATNERTIASLGWSPNALAALTWTVGGALAGLAGILVAPLTGLSVGALTLVATISGLAAALLGGFRSFPLTLAGGLLLGIGESEVTRYQIEIKDFLGAENLSGLPRAVPFLVIIIVLVVRGRGLPLRSHVAEQLPSLGTGRVNLPAAGAAAAALAALSLWVFDTRWLTATTLSVVAALFILSIVVLTGFTGQLSLAQYTLGGVGALIAAKLVANAGWTPELAFLAGILLTVPVGLLFAVPALRTRGVNLAVVTLGLGFTVQEMLFNNPNYTGNPVDGGTKVGPTELFGIDVDAVTYPERWAVVCIVGFLLGALVVANLRRSRTGRRLIAVRTNERAAASLGISVFGAKLYAFGVSAGIAALAGILLAFQNPTVTYGAFNPFESINAVGIAVIGGIGWVLGAVFGGPSAPGGFASLLLESKAIGLGEWVTFISGALLVVILIVNPNGLADGAIAAIRRLGGQLVRRPPTVATETLPEATAGRVPHAVLEVRDVVVRFGGVTAVEDVSLDLHPGEVVGLIGPNGAGKTTLIDAITGFVKPVRGSIALGQRSLDHASASRRARAGLRRSFQSLELFEDVTVAENLRAGADRASRLSWLTDLFRPGRHPLPPTAVDAIRTFGLEDDLPQRPTQLPYGRRRLVGIARAVASGPSVIMLDEPAAGLDETESQELATLIRALADERGMAVLLVEHDVRLVMSTCNRVIVLDFGRVISQGTPEEVRNDPAVIAAYLGGPAEHGEPAEATR
ncbi:MAG: branched-chain amino acid ABC transporter permease/ATP-binding protein [Acidimicrobiia bacterium]|nr:branched-chain amino acid ABC transporter permease/ATP-binding protein [Acidimicrobiia bacterium]